MRTQACASRIGALVGVVIAMSACSDSGGTSAKGGDVSSTGGSNASPNGGATSDTKTETSARNVGGASTSSKRATGSGGASPSTATDSEAQAPRGGTASTDGGNTSGLGGRDSVPQTKSGKGGGVGGRAGAGGTISSGTTVVGTGGRSKAVGTTETGGTSKAGAPTGSTSTVEASSSKGCGVTDPLKSGRASIDVSGTKREYVLKLPDNYVATKPYKLIFTFHWKGGSANDVVTGTTGGGPYYGLEQRAGGSAIFVAPEGIDAGFANTNGRDIALVRAILELFESKLCIDTTRIFSTGFSYGGMMSDSIGCEMADVFRAIAPMSGGIPSAQHAYSGCNQANNHPIAVWMAHGDSDTVVPIADGKAALAIFVARNQCQSQTSPVTPSPCVAYQGCATGYPVHWCQFSGGHGAPNFASAAIWDFFDQF